MNLYHVRIETPSTIKGNVISIMIRARSQDEAMDRALVIRGLDYGTVDKIAVTPITSCPIGSGTRETA